MNKFKQILVIVFFVLLSIISLTAFITAISKVIDVAQAVITALASGIVFAACASWFVWTFIIFKRYNKRIEEECENN